MSARYGPWSSALGDVHTTRLSTFWRRRLTMLPTTRAAPTALTRRDWLKLGAAGVAAGSLPTLLLARPDGARPEGRGRIFIQAFAKNDADPARPDSGVFAVDPEAATWVKVSDLYGSVRISRDGRTLAVSRAGKSADGKDIENTGVWTLDAAGQGEPRRIADFGGVTCWSPDGAQLLVAKWLSKPGDDESRSETWRFGLDGAAGVKLPIPETEEVNDWSPDGQWLVTVSDRHRPHGSGYQLYLMRPDGSDERRLTEGGGLNVFPRFSPDGRRIVYTHQEKSVTSLWVVNIDGSDRRRVFQEENDTAPDHACWSPDGKTLATTLQTWARDEKGNKFLGGDHDGNPRIALIEVDGGGVRPLDLPRAAWLGAPDWR